MNCIKKYLLACLAILLLFIQAQAQTSGKKTVRGYVRDEDGEPIPGAFVQVQGSNTGTLTNADGYYEISINSDQLLVYSFIGSVTQTLKTGNRTTVNVVLEKDVEQLEDAVVVAFGSQKKVTITGSIATVSSTELKKTTATRLDNALAGRVAGLTSMQSSGGQPGADGATMYLRGASTTNGQNPLILVDGVERGSDAIRTIDINEVENISVLKDASATALYGIQGANGVILIQTRQGHIGKPKFNITFDQSLVSFTKEYERVHSWDYCRFRNEALINDGAAPAYSEEIIAKYKNPTFGLTGSEPWFNKLKRMREYLYCDNDYYRLSFKRNTPQTRANANISGGTENIKYFLNVGYIHQDGNLRTEDPELLGYNPQCFMDRISLRSNIDFKLTKSLNLSFKIASYAENFNMPPMGGYFNNERSVITDLIYYSKAEKPISPGPATIKEFGVEDGQVLTYNYLDHTTYECINYRGFRTNKKKNLNTQLSINWDLSSLIKGLSINGMASYDTYNRGILEGTKSVSIYTSNPDYENDYLYYSLVRSSDPLLKLNSSRISQYSIYAQASVNYRRSFGKHNVSAMVNAYRKYWESASAEIPYNILGSAARVTYSYDNRYLAEVNAGYNGSEQFAPSNRFGFFPSASAGYVISNEPFFKASEIKNVLSWLKIRGSYGLVGNDSIGGSRFLYLDNITVGGGTTAGGLGGKTISIGLLGNKSLTWELSRKMDAAIEIGLFKNLRINFDYYKEHRNQILLTRQSIPIFQGTSIGSIPKVNMGIVDSQGYEIELKYTKMVSKDFSFSVNGNLGINDNTVIESDEPMRTDDYAYKYRTEGFRLGQAWGYLIDWNSPGKGYFLSQDEINSHASYASGTPRVGDFVYKDVNGDNIIDDKDLSPIGWSTSIPGLNYGLDISVSFRGFDFNVLFSGLGRYSRMYDFYEYSKEGVYYSWHKNAWTPERYQNGAKITYPALSTAESVSTRSNDFFIQDHGFLRLKNLELGYTFPRKLLQKADIKSLRVYVTGRNLFVWSKCPVSDTDPEQNGKDVYPITKNISFGVNISF